MTGLYGLYGLCKKFEYEFDEARDPLYEIIKQTFGFMGGLIN